MPLFLFVGNNKNEFRLLDEARKASMKDLNNFSFPGAKLENKLKLLVLFYYLVVLFSQQITILHSQLHNKYFSRQICVGEN